jgi:hypothetical protein
MQPRRKIAEENVGLDGKSKGAFAFMFLVGAGLAGRFLLDLWAERRLGRCRRSGQCRPEESKGGKETSGAKVDQGAKD